MDMRKYLGCLCDKYNGLYKPRLILYRFPSVGPKPFYQEEETVRLLLPQINCSPCGYKFWSICPTKKMQRGI